MPATSLVDGLEETLALDSWPDPRLTWYSSTLKDTSPSKKYHLSSRCSKVKSLKTITTAHLTLSEVGNRWCTACFELDHATGPPRAKRSLTDWVASLRTLAAAVDAGDVPDPVRVRSLRSKLDNMGRYAPYVTPLRDMLNTASQVLADVLSTTAVSDNHHRVAAQVHLAAAMLTVPADLYRREREYGIVTAPSRRDLALVGGSRHFSHAWEAFTRNLGEGKSLAEARAAAAADLAKDLSLAHPREVAQLAGLSVTATTAGQKVTIADFIELWSAQRAELERAVLDDWVNMVTENVERSHEVGTLVVKVPQAPPRGVHPTFVEWAMSGLYPLATNPSGGVLVTVPAAVAVYLERLVGGVVVASEGQEQLVDLGAKLRIQGVPALEAYATAKVVLTEAG